MKIIIQAGHEGRVTGATGAPNEQSFNIDISNKVADEMRARGVEVKRVGADPLPEEIAGNWDLFLSIHYDADIYGMGGYFVDFPEPSTDGSTDKSQNIASNLRREYGDTTEIVHHPERSNVNTRYYYMWKKLSYATPCVIIECGVGMHVPDDHQILHFDRPLVVKGIVKGLCLGLGILWEAVVVPEPTPEPPVTDPSVPTDPCGEQNAIISDLNNEIRNDKLYIERLELVRDKVEEIVFGKGWTWTKIFNLKKLLA